MDEVSVLPSKKNKDLIQSYTLTTMRDDIGLYGQRLILRLVEAANATGVTQGLDFKRGTNLIKSALRGWSLNCSESSRPSSCQPPPSWEMSRNTPNYIET